MISHESCRKPIVGGNLPDDALSLADLQQTSDRGLADSAFAGELVIGAIGAPGVGIFEHASQVLSVVGVDGAVFLDGDFLAWFKNGSFE